MAPDPISRALDEALVERYPSWRAFAERARGLLSSGIAHDGRYAGGGPLLPAAEGKGPRKRDVDGNEFVDCWTGHELEHRWAELVTRLVPSAERVRFVSSGTLSLKKDDLVLEVDFDEELARATREFIFSGRSFRKTED